MSLEKIKISVVIPAKNEEKNIARCLQGLNQFADEVIVLIDSTTTDNTASVANTFPFATVKIVEWEGFAKTKQKGFDSAKNDWIFWLDADEAVTPDLIKELISFKSAVPSYKLYSVPRKAYFLGKWIQYSGWYPGRVTRLFDRRFVKMSDHDVHEKLICDSPTGELQYPLDHFTDPSVEHYFQKFNSYTTLAAKELANRGKTVTVFTAFLRGLFAFVKMFVIKRGFLDGSRGFILAVFSANYVFTKYVKLFEMNTENK